MLLMIAAAAIIGLLVSRGLKMGSAAAAGAMWVSVNHGGLERAAFEIFVL
jgi:hypothetical protein